MSSSVFIESAVPSKNSSLGAENLVGDVTNPSVTADSDLVVVYGKNSVNYDAKGLEKLIEEKTLSSISVIRISSPTSSMQDAEEQAEKQGNFDSDDDSVGSNTESNSAEEDKRRENDTTNDDDDDASDEGLVESTDDDDDDGNGTNTSDDDITDDKKSNKKNLKTNKYKGKKLKVQKSRRARKERPEIVSLTIEEFYPTKEADAVVKNVLKKAGVPTIKQAEYEFQMYVIKNDHCYTPFTSPEQMKNKLAIEKTDADKQTTRKILPQSVIGTKQQTKSKSTELNSKRETVLLAKATKLKPNNTQNYSDDDILGDDDDNIDIFADEKDDEDKEDLDLDDDEDEDEEEFTDSSEESAETDNDRESDLDFNVNQRKGRKIKIFKKIKRSAAHKPLNKRRQQSLDDLDKEIIGPLPVVAHRTKVVRSGNSETTARSAAATSSSVATATTASANNKTIFTISKKAVPLPHAKQLSEAVAALPPIPRKQPTVPAHTSNHPANKVTHNIPSTQQTILAAGVRRGPIVQVSAGHTPIRGSQMQSSPQTVKEIVINKVMASPKGGFTDISALLTQTHATTTNKPTPTPIAANTQTPRLHMPTTPKGFTPLGMDAAIKKQLPEQISIQTHQSSSELAAEHDKQLDLIDSIVQDQLQKTNVVEQQQTASVNENIPELVKMLESTEKALETKHVTNTQQMPSYANSSLVDDIDISNAPLLETPEVDIPDDLLQDVVDLMKDDKTLQAAVEKQVFGGVDDNSVSDSVGVAALMSTPPPLAPIFQQLQKANSSATPMLQEMPPKSIIQMSISNIAPVMSSSGATTLAAANTSSTRIAGIHTPKTAPLVRNEPIQIVRGNGRVITLPPIEAPNTRAKRRAQAQPATTTYQYQEQSPNFTFNESSLDNSLQSNASSFANTTDVANTSLVVTAEKSANVAASRRRVSKEGGNSAANTSIARSATKKATGKKGTKAAAAAASVNKNDGDNSEIQDDDDPNKLWCICRQPHNNRFMICCDICGDWFHGTCVSITKAMGLEMEQKGVEWTCPQCVRKQEEKKQRKITDMLAIKKIIPTTTVLTTATPLQPQQQQTIFDPNTINTALTAPITDSEIMMPNAATVAMTTTPKPELTRKQQLDAKAKLQIGQFIPLKGLDQTKKSTPVTLITSGQRKLYSSTPNAKSGVMPAAQHAVRRGVVVLTAQQQQHVHQEQPQPPVKPQQRHIKAREDPPTTCIVCRKAARPNSIYCSDDCIRKHAQNALHAFSAKSPDPPTSVSSPNVSSAPDEKKKKAKGLFEDLLSMADRKPKIERVNVFERKSGRILTGSHAPTTINLKKWLQDNPTFEVVQPGSTQAIEIEKRQKQRSVHASSPTMAGKTAGLGTTLQHSPGSSPTISQHSPHLIRSISTSSSKHESETSVTAAPIAKSVKQLMEQAKHSPNNSRSNTPKPLQKYPQQVAIKPDKSSKTDAKEDTRTKEKSMKRQNSDNSKKATTEVATPPAADSEPIIRLNVRRTLKEQLLLRLNEETTAAANAAAAAESGNSAAASTPPIPPQLTTEEVEQFATETEEEMYNYFQRDTGHKYKAKYRSLMFNIKDRKNHTLFTKICAKLIKPKQLVRMSPEELASQELAKWRANEAKHQLEMIKKSELDLLSCAKNYVLKTHKGEEVIEGKSTDCVNLDMTIPVEDVVSVLNNTNVTSSDVIDEAAASPTLLRKHHHSFDLDAQSTSAYHPDFYPSSSVVDAEKGREEKSKSVSREKERVREREHEHDQRHHEHHHHHHHDRDKEHEHEKSNERERARDRDREKRHKSKDRHRDKSSRRRSHSRSRSRSRSRERKHKSSHTRDRDEREHEKERLKEKERSKTKEESADSKASEKKVTNTAASAKTSSNAAAAKEIKQRDLAKKSSTPKSLEAFSLIDQILESSKTVEEAANLVKESEVESEKVAVRPATPSQSHAQSSSNTKTIIPSAAVVDIDADVAEEEPTSTVSIATPPQDPYIRYTGSDSPASAGNNTTLSSSILWGGNINMIDVASFQIVLQPVVGNSLNMGKFLPGELDVVGRIGPDTVWDYISKIKKSPNKEIVIIRLVPSSESETTSYTHLYQYLDQRKRLGVIKTASSQIKDFYIFPLGAGKQMPVVLQPVERVDFYEDAHRPDMLVGIVIRVIGGKRTAAAASTHSTATTTASVAKSQRRVAEMDSPQGSPKRRKRSHSVSRKGEEFDIDAIIKAPIASKIQKASTAVISTDDTSTMDDADEPYSPGGSSDDDVPLLPLKSIIADTQHNIEDELKRKMDELNRQIAAQEMEIAGLLNVEPTHYAGTATSSSSAASTVLANISLPSNLSQILASIKGKSDTTPPMPVQAPPNAPPPPTIGAVNINATTANDDEEYNPEIVMHISNYEAKVKITEKTTTSRLAQLSEAELLSMVPDDMIEPTKTSSAHNKTTYDEPPPPGV